MGELTPTLHIQETADGVRLSLAGLTFGDGATLQDAADALIERLLVMAMGLRTDGMRVGSSDVPAPDVGALDFLYRLGEIAAAGGDIREHLFGI